MSKYGPVIHKEDSPTVMRVLKREKIARYLLGTLCFIGSIGSVIRLTHLPPKDNLILFFEISGILIMFILSTLLGYMAFALGKYLSPLTMYKKGMTVPGLISLIHPSRKRYIPYKNIQKIYIAPRYAFITLSFKPPVKFTNNLTAHAISIPKKYIEDIDNIIKRIPKEVQIDRISDVYARYGEIHKRWSRG